MFVRVFFYHFEVHQESGWGKSMNTKKQESFFFFISKFTKPVFRMQGLPVDIAAESACYVFVEERQFLS